MGDRPQHCRERRIPFFAALALFQGGALRAALGEGEAGLEEMDRGVAELMALGATKYLATWACFSRGVVLRQVGRDEEAMAMANAGLALAIETHESLVEAELHRLKGELQEQTGATDAAKASYRNALASAREQGSRWFELRAATRLANLHRKEGDPERARELLAPLVDRFPQSLDMAVLAEARGLLETL